MYGVIKTEDIDEVRERNNLIEVISEYITLKKAGRYYKALCPFHKEKTPSFIVDPAKQLYHCFGCGEGGNIYTFVMKMDGLEFPEAVRALAERVGYTLHVEESRKAKEAQSKKGRLQEINREAADFYHRFLLEGSEAAKAREYLKKRGYGGEIIEIFKLGLSPSQWDSLLTLLLKKGFKTEEVVEAGLAIKGEKGFYDRFRSRIIFPILDIKGRAVGLGGRVLGDELPKYMNSPETPIYHKSSTLYGLYHCKGEIVAQNAALVVEGYTDVLSLYKAGIKNVVATLGTTFTSEHVRLLSRFAELVVLIFDADVAGATAAERGLEYSSDFRLPGYDHIGDLTEKTQVDVRVAVLPEGTDPADFADTQGASKFRDLVERAVPLPDFCLDLALSRHDLSTNQGRIKATREALTVIASLKNAVAQENYLRKLANQLSRWESLSYEAILSELKNELRTQGEVSRPLSTRGREKTKRDVQVQAEEEMLRMVLQYPEENQEVLSTLMEDYFTVMTHRRLWQTLKKSMEEGSKLEVATLVNQFDEDLRETASRLSLEEVVVEDKGKYCRDILRKLKEFGLQRQINSLKLKLERLNPEINPARYDGLFQELIELEAAKRELRTE